VRRPDRQTFQIDEVDSLLLEPRVTADGIAPIGVTAVGDDVAGLQDIGELRQHGIDRRTGGDVEQDESRRHQQSCEGLEVWRDLQAGAFQIVGNRMGVHTGDAIAFGERILCKVGAHLAEADNTEALNSV
jgi:hypothetical protein